MVLNMKICLIFAVIMVAGFGVDGRYVMKRGNSQNIILIILLLAF